MGESSTRVDETLGILGTGELFFEIGEAKAGVNALAQDATELSIAFDDCGRSAGVGRLEAAAMPAGPPPITTTS